MSSGLLLLLGVTLIVVGRTEASTGTVVSTSDTTIVAVGAANTMNVSINLAAADTLSGFDITLSYDPAVAVPTDVEVDARWNLPVVDCAPISDCSAGVLKLAYVQLPADNPCLGGTTCPIATITWQGVAGGSAGLQVADFQLSGTENDQVVGTGLTGVETSAGALSVQAPTQNTATNTATNTSTGTATSTPTNTAVPSNTTSSGNANGPTNTATPGNTQVIPASGSAGTSTPTSDTAATQSPSATRPASNTAVAPVTTSTPAESVAGEVTTGSGVTPVPPDAGGGFSIDGGQDRLTLVGLLMALVSLLVLVPSGIAVARDTHRRGAAERAMSRYLDVMENSGRDDSTRRR